MEVQGPRFWTGFGHDLRTFLKKWKKNVPPPVDPIQRVSGVRWRMDTNIDLVFIWVWSRLSAKVLVNLKLFENLMKSMNLKKTYEHWFSFYFSLKSFECKSILVNLKLFWNLTKSMNLRKTYEVLCSNSFWIEFVWWIADSEEENCDGFIMVLGGRKPVLNLLNENTCSVYWNAFDSRSDARTWISVLWKL